MGKIGGTRRLNERGAVSPCDRVADDFVPFHRGFIEGISNSYRGFNIFHLSIFNLIVSVFVTEYQWMWQLGLPPAACRVYAYIYGLTNAKNSTVHGFNSSKRALATNLCLDPGAVKRILDTLVKMKLIVYVNNVWQALPVNLPDSAPDTTPVVSDTTPVVSDNIGVVSGNIGVVSCNKSVVSGNKSVVSGNTIYNKETYKEEKEINCSVRESLATPEQPSASFDCLLSAFFAAGGKRPVPAECLRDSESMWNAVPPYKRQALIRALNNGTWLKPRLDWTISDFTMPEPTNYNGKDAPEGVQYVIALHNGCGGVYTLQDAQNYDMIIKKVL